ncbi:hypothetical protein SSPS47_27070 [Streptomyces sp. S4.7]|nr:hypothetical protein SSPS47_27070 [Streptomyces sp. S4.7]
MSTSHTHAETARELGALERTIDFYMHRNRVQFSLVTEFDRKVSEQTLVRALRDVQAQHPLLRVSVDRRAGQVSYAVHQPIPWRARTPGSRPCLAAYL